ncbi:hypothetical protein SLS57_008067 [Botryosphaeria dothidea]
MVKVAVAGGSGSINLRPILGPFLRPLTCAPIADVAREVIDKILAKKKHEVTVLTRKPVLGPAVDPDGIRWVQVDYSDKPSLTKVLRGIDVVLCFFLDLDYVSIVRNSKNLIDASVQAGVKRFAPSEWGSRINRTLPHNAFKEEIREYLEDTNSGRMRLEYTLFQPGLFVNYFGFPHTTTKHFTMCQPFIDFENRRAIAVDEDSASITLTTVQDMGAVVAEALDYEGAWPVDGGMRGTQTTVAEVIELARRLRDTWNKLLPHYRFTTAEEYLSGIWAGKL